MDALIVGAGPAGCAAALRAHARGLDVTIVDKATFPRDKTCGDGLTALALRLLDDLDVSIIGRETYEPVQDVRIIGPTRRVVDLELPGRSIAATIRRSDLDAALVDAVQARGIPVVLGDRVEHVESARNGAMVQLASGLELRARAVIAADGHYSQVRKCVAPSASADLGTWHATRQYHAGVQTSRLTVIFDRDLLPGYAWVFPLPGGRANVGMCVLRAQGRSGKEHHALWADLLRRPVMRDLLGANAAAEEPVRAWPIPCDYSTARLVHDRVLFVGDAAQVVDPLTGEGIAQALETGMLAIDALAAGGGPRTVADRYRRSVERAIGRDVRFASMLSRALASPIGARLSIALAGLTPWTRRNFGRWMFEDYPRALLLTPDRWGRRRFEGVAPRRAP